MYKKKRCLSILLNIDISDSDIDSDEENSNAENSDKENSIEENLKNTQITYITLTKKINFFFQNFFFI